MTASAPPSRTPRPHGRHQGFTLVELLIVVVILAVLAAIVVPTFNNASSEAKESALAANLATIRQAISLYRVQHEEIYPGQTNWPEFVTQLTMATTSAGATGSGANLGPYLRTAVPDNPMTDTSTGVLSTPMPGGPSGSSAYIYDPDTGEIRANLAGTAPSGTAWFDL
jgi:general secretion pathway protein G